MSNDRITYTSNAPVDEQLPGLQALMAPDRLAALLSERLPSSVVVDVLALSYVRYKPATSCVAAFTASLHGAGSDSTVTGYGKAYTDSDFAVALDKARSRDSRSYGDAPAFVDLPGENILVFFFPNDAEMKGLDIVAQPKKLQRLLYEHNERYPREEWRVSDSRMTTTILRYKPEKRAVVRVDTKVVNRHTPERRPLQVYLRSYADDRGADIARLMGQLYERAEGVTRLAVPRPIAYLTDPRLLVVEHLDGVTMTDLMQQPAEDAVVERAATALAELHLLDVDGLAHHGVDDLERQARATEQTLCAIAPGLAGTLDDVLSNWRARTEDLPAGNVGFVHGDFHYGQVLVAPDRVGILDFDRAYIGDPLADVGNFCAHARLMQIEGRLDDADSVSERFVRAYENACGHGVAAAAVLQYTVFGLFQLTVRPFRSLRAGWRSEVEALVNEVVRLSQ